MRRTTRTPSWRARHGTNRPESMIQLGENRACVPWLFPSDPFWLSGGRRSLRGPLECGGQTAGQAGRCVATAAKPCSADPQPRARSYGTGHGRARRAERAGNRGLHSRSEAVVGGRPVGPGGPGVPRKDSSSPALHLNRWPVWENGDPRRAPTLPEDQGLPVLDWFGPSLSEPSLSEPSPSGPSPSGPSPSGP